MDVELDLKQGIPKPLRSDDGIGAAGFFTRDVQLKAYLDAGYHIASITSRTPERAREVAELLDIPRANDTVDEMLDDPAVEILDIAVPSDLQGRIIEQTIEAHSRSRDNSWRGGRGSRGPAY
jgi:Oxidoreductase family, NAD-binding Rossmann fold